MDCKCSSVKTMFILLHKARNQAGLVCRPWLADPCLGQGKAKSCWSLCALPIAWWAIKVWHLSSWHIFDKREMHRALFCPLHWGLVANDKISHLLSYRGWCLWPITSCLPRSGEDLGWSIPGLRCYSWYRFQPDWTVMNFDHNFYWVVLNQ